MPTTLIHTPALSAVQLSRLSDVFQAGAVALGACYRLEHEQAVSRAAIDTLRNEWQLDINTLPVDFDPAAVRLVISDMDSTLITIECVDEIADFVGLKPQVAAITAAAMRGELNFEASLTRRVGLLKGLPVDALQQVYEQRLQLSPGVEALMAGLKQRGIKMALVSGGFTFFTERLEHRLKLDYTLANVLQVQDGKLTGEVMGRIIGAEAKREFLQHLCDVLAISPQQAIALGDGANDLQMLGLAGLGVAYRAKPTVREQADVSLQYRGLDAVLDFLG